ncbi:hypothetical protein NDU88_002554 [Pleurodeles waltl]|uniref:Uncharacterized protein n=1 Tax=Pleurodeles waltl TaxID=8319 RepID=A0AAV7TKV0_PLEWA|nr:hypothetical protein NDU88_002554 [Pleurodeles waltl]
MKGETTQGLARESHYASGADRRVTRGHFGKRLTFQHTRQPGRRGLLQGDARRRGKEGEAERRALREDNEEDVEVGQSTEEEEVEGAEESSERSSEAERTWEMEIPAEDGQTPQDAKFACHVPGGT